MNVDPSEPEAVQTGGFNQVDSFAVLREPRSGQCSKQAEDFDTLLQILAGELSKDERVTEDLIGVQEGGQPGASMTKVLHPNGRIDQDHAAGLGRRREMGRSRRSAPARDARRRALSRAIRASSPRRTSAVFSSTPVSLAAWRSNSSSILSVVLICISMHDLGIRVKCKSVRQPSFSPRSDGAAEGGSVASAWWILRPGASHAGNDPEAEQDHTDDRDPQLGDARDD